MYILLKNVTENRELRIRDVMHTMFINVIENAE
jgi:hypothetical protein